MGTVRFLESIRVGSNSDRPVAASDRLQFRALFPVEQTRSTVDYRSTNRHDAALADECVARVARTGRNGANGAVSAVSPITTVGVANTRAVTKGPASRFQSMSRFHSKQSAAGRRGFDQTGSARGDDGSTALVWQATRRPEAETSDRRRQSCGVAVTSIGSIPDRTRSGRIESPVPRNRSPDQWLRRRVASSTTRGTVRCPRSGCSGRSTNSGGTTNSGLRPQVPVYRLDNEVADTGFDG